MLSLLFSWPHHLYRDLTLHGNRWHCDCKLLEMYMWLRNFSAPTSTSTQPKCQTPARLFNEVIREVAADELACLPRVAPTSLYLEVIDGKNISLLCTITVGLIFLLNRLSLFQDEGVANYRVVGVN